MNAIFHKPISVEVTQRSAITPEGNHPIPNQYSLVVTYEPDKPAVIFHGVYVSAKIAAALSDKDLKGFTMVGLEIGSRERRCLGCWIDDLHWEPYYAVLGAELGRNRW